MLIRQTAPFETGYTAITEIGGPHGDMMLDFGILILEPNESLTSCEADGERAFLLLDGKAELSDGAHPVPVSRSSVLDDGPWAIHAAAGSTIEIRAISRCEFAIEKSTCKASFPTRIYSPDDSRSQRFGEGTMQETSTRTVRTIFDAATHPESGMVLGEVINHPGKWSSYPPHSHQHPEIYHYRFFPEQGFGFSQTGDEVARVTNRDTVTIRGDVVHPQTAAPGYAMFYVWMIPHLPNNRFGPDSRVFEDKHSWVMDPKANIWPDVGPALTGKGE